MWFAVLALDVLLLIGLWVSVKYGLATDVTRPRCLVVTLALVAGSLLVGTASLIYADLTVLLGRNRSAFSNLSTYVLLMLPGLQAGKLLRVLATEAGSSTPLQLEKSRSALSWATRTVLDAFLLFYAAVAIASVAGAAILAG